METIPENPTPRSSAQSTMPAAMAPDWEISARFPAHGTCAAKLALRVTPGIMMPRQFGPISLIPYFCAARSAASASEPAPWPSPAVIIRAPAAPRAPACSMRLGTAVAGAVITNQFGHKRQFVEATDRGNAIDLGIMRIHKSKIAFEFRLKNIPENGPPDRTGARTGPDQCDRSGRKQIFQMIGRHRINCPTGAGLYVMNLGGVLLATGPPNATS